MRIHRSQIIVLVFLSFLFFGLTDTVLAACASDTDCAPPATCQAKTEVTEQACADNTECVRAGQGRCVGVQNIPQEDGGYKLVRGHCEYVTKECVGGGTEPVPEMHATTEECFLDDICKTTPGGKCENVGLRKNDNGGWDNVPGAPGYCVYPYSGTEVKFQPTVPSLLINIPGFKGFTNQGLTGADEEGYIYPPFIGQYVGAVYKWAILIGALVATIITIYGGFMYLISRGNATAIEDAKSRIKGALLGLFLILGSYTLLYLINPDLVRFRSLKILAIKPEYVSVEEPELYDEEMASGQQVTEITGLVAIPDTNLIIANNKKARADVVAALQKAVEKYDGDVTVSAGARTAADQWRLVKKYCKCKDESQIPADVPAGAWQPYCAALSGCRASYKKLGRQGGQFTLGSTAGHVVGNAVDINARGGSYDDCQELSNEERLSQGVVLVSGLKVANPCVPKNQQLFIKEMIQNGFCVGLKSGSAIRESWHFELTTNGLPLSPFCVKELSDSNLQKLYYLQNEE